MIKVGDKVSLFANMGKVGVVTNSVKGKLERSYMTSTGTTTSTLVAVISWEDGSMSSHNFASVMRLE